MARGKDAHDAKVAALAALGKDLSRRASSRCELCEEGDGLRPHPIDDGQVDLDGVLLACARCRELIEAKRLPRDVAALRFLETAMWSEVAPVQIAAVRLLRRLAPEVAWAREALDGLWLDEAIEARV